MRMPDAENEHTGVEEVGGKVEVGAGKVLLPSPARRLVLALEQLQLGRLLCVVADRLHDEQHHIGAQFDEGILTKQEDGRLIQRDQQNGKCPEEKQVVVVRAGSRRG